jgi:hypothetical protein
MHNLKQRQAQKAHLMFDLTAWCKDAILFGEKNEPN